MRARFSTVLEKVGSIIQYVSIRVFVWGLSLLPLAAQRRFLSSILLVVSTFLPRYREIAYRNLTLVFPDLSEEEKASLYTQSFSSMADLLIDLARFPRLTAEWAEKQIVFPNLTLLKDLKQQNPGKGIILATGHLGSFELSGFCLPFLYRPVGFIIRNFKNPYLDKWWNSLRECSGNEVIPRKGAFKRSLRALREGKDVGILFDQNVTRQNAIFVNWFGKCGATTKALSLLALQTEAPIVVVALIRTGTDIYLYECQECCCFDIYRNPNTSKDEKLRLITDRVVSAYEEVIKKYPETWFWVHRKWKTQPEGQEENFYSRVRTVASPY